MKINIPSDALLVMDALTKGGYEAFAVGGCVRDSLLNIPAHDWDICTNALPAQMKACFEGFKTLDIGLKHGTITVVIGDGLYEVTTYRIDGEYLDNRHPQSVSFTSELSLDLARRDFTVNAMAYEPKTGLHDPFGGAKDLENGIIRAVGEPDVRFGEDALRILRGLRFASRFGFKIEKNTSESIIKNAPLLNNIAAERISSELSCILCGGGAEDILNTYREVFAVIIPELRQCFDFEQCSDHHIYDVYRHITHSVGIVRSDLLLRLTMLLHDIGKPRVCTQDQDGKRHFKGHQLISAEIAETVLNRLKYPKQLISDCVRLVYLHDFRFNGSKKQLKRLLGKVGAETMQLLFEVERADVRSQSDFRREEKLQIIDTAEAQFKEILAEEECFSVKELKINGNDLILLGYPENRKIGETLEILLNEVIDEELPNDRAALLNRAAELKP